MVEQVSKSNWYKAFAHMRNSIDYDTDCNFHAKIIKYDKQEHTADLLPLNNFSDGSKHAQILDVPVDRCCYEFDEWLQSVKGDFAKVDAYADDKGIAIGSGFAGKIPKPLMRVGAVAICCVMDHDTDNWDGSANTYTPASNRQHDLNDAIVIGVM